jgi:hypothetical protein
MLIVITSNIAYNTNHAAFVTRGSCFRSSTHQQLPLPTCLQWSSDANLPHELFWQYIKSSCSFLDTTFLSDCKHTKQLVAPTLIQFSSACSCTKQPQIRNFLQQLNVLAKLNLVIFDKLFSVHSQHITSSRHLNTYKELSTRYCLATSETTVYTTAAASQATGHETTPS